MIAKKQISANYFKKIRHNKKRLAASFYYGYCLHLIHWSDKLHFLIEYMCDSSERIQRGTMLSTFNTRNHGLRHMCFLGNILLGKIFGNTHFSHLTREAKPDKLLKIRFFERS